MVYVLFNVRENDIFVICIKRYNLFLQFFLGKMLYYLYLVIYNNNKNGKKIIFFNNMVINQDIVY